MPLTPCSAAEMLAVPEAEKPVWGCFDTARHSPDRCFRETRFWRFYRGFGRVLPGVLE